ncbi:Putative transposase for insertion sequence element [Streptomyces lydicus]|nr:Putative transposase for insertion sequence element [Streptomyces lydicus]
MVTALRREGADPVRKGRPWSLPLEDRVLLVAAYWRTNLTLRQLAPLFGVSKSAADRIIDHLGPSLALQPRKRFRKGTVLIVDGTLVPTRDHQVAEQSKNYRYSTSHQVIIDADTRLIVAVGRPLPANRNDCKAWELSGAMEFEEYVSTRHDADLVVRAGILLLAVAFSAVVIGAVLHHHTRCRETAAVGV